jgi:histidine triad (HIT) family protein
MMKKDPVLDALRKASKGLRYTSETDAPLEPLVWPDAPKLAGAKERTLDSFFHAVPSEDKAKFQKLADVLKQQLSDIKVYTVGNEAEKQAYIVGKTTDGRWVGLKTTVVET